MKNLLYPYFFSGRAAVGLLVLRLIFGAAFIFHGMGKMAAPFNWMGDTAPVPGILQALAAFSEFGGGIAMILGLLTPLAALGLIGTMTVAVLMAHLPAGDPFVATEPGKGSYELALVYWGISLLMLLAGPGVISVDALLFNRKKSGVESLNYQPTV